MLDLNGNTLEINDLVKIAGNKNDYIWRLSAQLPNGLVTITRGLDNNGIIHPTQLVWITSPRKKPN